jgi:DNA-binding MarR family transcriptional regulator
MDNTNKDNTSSQTTSSGQEQSNNISAIGNIIFDYLDRCRFLFYPEQWNHIFLDFSKNDIFTLIFLYRKREVNVTEIADYLKVPLNTVTGVISRLEQKELVIRERSKLDKRVVCVRLDRLGLQMIEEELQQFSEYYLRIMEELTPDEKTLLFGLIDRIFNMLDRDIHSRTGDHLTRSQPVKRITIE